MLQNGSTVRNTLDLIREVEGGSPAGREVTVWNARLAEGQRQFPALTAGGKVFPLLFIWLVSGSGEDWASGFRNAANVYYQRAVYKVELMLYAVLPVTILALGILIITQVIPIARAILGPMNDMMTGVGE